MLHVSIHAGRLKEVCAANRLDWLDIGYAKLGAKADYRVALFRVDRGAAPIVDIKLYPRWSASVWDLVVRAIALGLSAQPGPPIEQLPDLTPLEEPIAVPGSKRKKPQLFADAEILSAIVYHQASEGTEDSQVATMQVDRQRARGVYRAKLTEDRRPAVLTEEFLFRPEFLIPCELVARAALMALTGSIKDLPERPSFKMPVHHMVDGVSHVVIRHIPEPARTGFIRFLHKIKQAPANLASTKDAAVPTTLYSEFVEKVA